MLIPPYESAEAIVDDPVLLVVANDPLIHGLFQRLFRDEHTLRSAKNAAAALEALQCEQIDAIVLDVTDADFDGIDTLKQIRSSKCGATLPVVLISALDDNQAAVEGLQQGASDYVTKPLDESVVRARVNTQIALKQAEDERKRSLTHLKFTQEMQENFTRIVSHDLKGPLTNIRMAQFMLRDIVRDNDEASVILDNMDATVNGMIDMLRDFLDAMDSQQLQAKLTTFQAGDLVVQIVEQYRLAAERKRIRLAMRDCDRQIVADERLLRQVLGNLVSNAIKFSPPGTETSVWTEPNGDFVRICVADGGPGIPPEERRNLFQMFSKLSTRPTAGESSTGLGLWIVKELMQLQKGRVGFDQPETGGSLFWVELPVPTSQA